MNIIDYPVSHFSKGRPYGIHNIIIHHMAGVLTAKTCANVLEGRNCSAHYGIGSDGVIGRYVDEKNRAWHASDGVGKGSKGNDKGIGIEVTNDNIRNYHVSDQSFDILVDLCYDIAARNGLLPLEVGRNLFGHRDCGPTYCPGDYLYGRLGDLAARVNAKQPVPQPTPVKKSFLPLKGYWGFGDNDPRVGILASFMRKNFPAYTKPAALGNYYGPNLKSSITEFQRRAKKEGRYNDVIDGNTGPKTYAALQSYGFKYEG